MHPTKIRLSSILFLAVLFCLSCAAPRPEPPKETPMPDPDTAVRIFTGPVFLTDDPDFPEARAVAVKADGTILEFYSRAPHDTPWEVIPLPGELALPGLHDAHLHISGIGTLQEQVLLYDCTRPDEAAVRVSDWGRGHPEQQIIMGRGWDQNHFPTGEFPTWRDLEPAAARPVVLRRVDGHAAWINKAMLDLAGITARTKSPDGGRIIRDSQGEPTGILLDNAMDLLDDFIPEPTPDEIRNRLIAGMRVCAGKGLVAVHDMGLPPESMKILQQLAAAGEMPVRVFAYMEGSDDEGFATFQDYEKRTGLLSIQGVKLYTDGALGSRGAALLAPYSDAPGTRGLTIHTAAELEAMFASIHDRGGQITVHAIGDRGNRMALDAIEKAQGADRSRRHRIEHAQIVHPEDFKRFAESGVIASMQPTHCTSDLGWAGRRLGPEREAGAYAWRTMLDLGVPLAFGSDAPVEDCDPLPGIYAAITRRNRAGDPPGGWHPEQALTWREAVDAFTRGAAFAVGREHDLGRLAIGYQCDITVLDRDPRGSAEAWLDAKPTITIVGGRVNNH